MQVSQRRFVQVESTSGLLQSAAASDQVRLGRSTIFGSEPRCLSLPP